MHMAVRTAKITAVLLIPYPSMIGSADAGVVAGWSCPENQPCMGWVSSHVYSVQ
jgi:hypothetical protein